MSQKMGFVSYIFIFATIVVVVTFWKNCKVLVNEFASAAMLRFFLSHSDERTFFQTSNFDGR